MVRNYPKLYVLSCLTPSKSSVQEVVKFTSSNHMQFNLLASPNYFISAGGQNIHQNIVKRYFNLCFIVKIVKNINL